MRLVPDCRERRHQYERPGQRNAPSDQRTATSVSTSLRQTIGQPVWQAGSPDFFLGHWNVVRNTIKRNGRVSTVIEHERCSRIIVPRLPYGPGIDHVVRVLAQINLEFLRVLGRLVVRDNHLPQLTLFLHTEPTLNVRVAEES